MKSQATLPEGYEEILSIDLQKDKRLMLTVNGAALLIVYILLGDLSAVLISVAMIVLGIILHPIKIFYHEQFLIRALMHLAIIGVGSVLYIILHEAVHGVFMRLFCRVKPRFGFTGLYAYAGSDAYYAKLPYIIIALAPVVIWGVVLMALCLLFPDFFWAIYFIQITNISGAAGDLFVTAKFLRLPKDILVRDTGVSMTVYGTNAAEAGAAE